VLFRSGLDRLVQRHVELRCRAVLGPRSACYIGEMSKYAHLFRKTVATNNFLSQKLGIIYQSAIEPLLDSFILILESIWALEG